MAKTSVKKIIMRETFERRESDAELALRALAKYSSKLNEGLGFELLDDEGRLRPEVFIDEEQRGYETEEVAADLDHVRRKEIMYAGLDNERVVKFKATEAGLNTAGVAQEELVAQLLKLEGRRKYKHDGSQAEVAIPLALAEALGDRYLVVRTSEYDDFEAGVDHLIIDRQTGLVVCAIDEVVESGRTVEKQERSAIKLRRGGSSIKYGLRVVDGRLVKGRLSHLATFIMPIEKQNISGCLKELAAGQSGNFSRQVVANIVASMESQLENLVQVDDDRSLDKQALQQAIAKLREFSGIQS